MSTAPAKRLNIGVEGVEPNMTGQVVVVILLAVKCPMPERIVHIAQSQERTRRHHNLSKPVILTVDPHLQHLPEPKTTIAKIA